MEGQAAKNGAFLILDVSVKGVTGTVTTNPYFWTVKDALGHTYQVDYMANKEPALNDSGPLGPGEISRGFITFDVPQGAMIVTMSGGIHWVIPAS